MSDKETPPPSDYSQNSLTQDQCESEIRKLLGEIKTVAQLQLDLAAAMEENTKLKAHAEAMRDAAKQLPEHIEGWCEPLSDAVAAFDADFPPGEPR